MANALQPKAEFSSFSNLPKEPNQKAFVVEEAPNVKSLKEMYEKQAKEKVALQSKYETAAVKK